MKKKKKAWMMIEGNEDFPDVYYFVYKHFYILNIIYRIVNRNEKMILLVKGVPKLT